MIFKDYFKYHLQLILFPISNKIIFITYLLLRVLIKVDTTIGWYVLAGILDGLIIYGYSPKSYKSTNIECGEWLIVVCLYGFKRALPTQNPNTLA